MKTLTITNKQRSVRINLKWLRQAAAAALEASLATKSNRQSSLQKLDEIDVAIVSDSTIERVHINFMGITGATDVITFEHGEIIVSADTATACAKEHGHSVEQELALYITHGFLHLAGYDDMTPRERKRMHTVQNRIWREVCAAIPI